MSVFKERLIINKEKLSIEYMGILFFLTCMHFASSIPVNYNVTDLTKYKVSSL